MSEVLHECEVCGAPVADANRDRHDVMCHQRADRSSVRAWKNAPGTVEHGFDSLVSMLRVPTQENVLLLEVADGSAVFVELDNLSAAVQSLICNHDKCWSDVCACKCHLLTVAHMVRREGMKNGFPEPIDGVFGLLDPEERAYAQGWNEALEAAKRSAPESGDSPALARKESIAE